ncbi:c-type cytochrome [Paracoccus jiaweipingae]|uniref:c-type cytochrome n=1 Tax=unclassified Paracoccus (in: a-proteobacteria) TaxID=2688777 RepID=UPI0037B7BDAE
MRKLIAATLMLTLPAAAVWADEAQEAAVEGRHGYFTMLGIEMGKLAPVAKGEAEYDAAVASDAATKLAALGSYDVTGLFVDGTANGSYDDSDALPKIWENKDDFKTKYEALKTATAELAAVAGDGKDAMVPAFAKVGGTCKACHDDYRAKN